MDEENEVRVSAGAVLARVDTGPLNDLDEAADPFAAEPVAERIAAEARADDEDLAQCWYCHFLNGALGRRDKNDPLHVPPSLEAHFQERLQMGARQSTESIAKILHAEWAAKVYEPLRARGEPAVEPFRMSVAKFVHCIRNHTAPVHVAMHQNDILVSRMHVAGLLYDNLFMEDESGARVLNLQVIALYDKMTKHDGKTQRPEVSVQIWNDRSSAKRARR